MDSSRYPFRVMAFCVSYMYRVLATPSEKYLPSKVCVRCCVRRRMKCRASHRCSPSRWYRRRTISFTLYWWQCRSSVHRLRMAPCCRHAWFGTLFFSYDIEFHHLVSCVNLHAYSRQLDDLSSPAKFVEVKSHEGLVLSIFLLFSWHMFYQGHFLRIDRVFPKFWPPPE